MKKSVKIIIITIASVLLLLVLAYLSYELLFNPYRGTIDDFSESESLDTVLTKEQAQRDMDCAMNYIKSRHPAWLEKENARVTEVERLYKELRESFGDTVTVSDLNTALGTMIAPLHDGHTYAKHYTTVQTMLDDCSYVETERPIRINGEDANDIVKRYLTCHSYEIEEDAIADFFEKAICYEAELRKIDVDTSKGVDFTYVIDGKEETIHHEFIKCIEGNRSVKTEQSDRGWVYYDIDKERNLGVFTLTTCTCNQEYLDTVKEFFEEVSQAGIENVAVDLRGNGGGNSAVANEFIRYLNVDEYNTWDCDIRYGLYLHKFRSRVMQNMQLSPQFKGNLYILTDRKTFSSAMDFTMLIMDNDLGKVVGEASSNLPDSYGDCLYFLLPNSKINLSVSFKRWYRIDKTKAWQQLVPDYECNPSMALKKVYEIISQ